MLLAKPRNLARQSMVIRVKVYAPPACYLLGIRCVTGPVEKLAVARRGGVELRRGLPRLKGNTGGVAIGVDDRARKRGADDSRPEVVREAIKLVDPPVRILAREPW